MRRWAGALVLALGLGGCASTGAVLGLGGRDGPVASGPYMQQAAAADLYGIEASRIAVARAQRPEVRAYAEMLLADHTLFANRLLGAAAHEGLTPPTPALEPAQQAMLARLQAAGAGSFDGLYMGQQRQAQRSALGLHRTYALLGDEPKIRTLAGSASYWVHEHLRHADRID